MSAESKFDRIKWVLVFVIVIGGIIVNYYYCSVALPIRSAFGIVLFCIALGFVSWTVKGRLAWEFVKAARNELRKVVWPNREETVKTTAMVVVMVLVMALILWGVDTFFIWLIGFFASHRG